MFLMWKWNVKKKEVWILPRNFTLASYYTPLWNASQKTVKNLMLNIHFFKIIYVKKILKGRGDNLVLSMYIKKTAINDSFLVHPQLLLCRLEFHLPVKFTDQCPILSGSLTVLKLVFQKGVILTYTTFRWMFDLKDIQSMFRERRSVMAFFTLFLYKSKYFQF